MKKYPLPGGRSPAQFCAGGGESGIDPLLSQNVP
jgi:hypothetical protein